MSTVSALPDQGNSDQSSRARQNNSGSSMEKACKSEAVRKGIPGRLLAQRAKGSLLRCLVLDCLAPDVDPHLSPIINKPVASPNGNPHARSMVESGSAKRKY